MMSSSLQNIVHYPKLDPSSSLYFVDESMSTIACYTVECLQLILLSIFFIFRHCIDNHQPTTLCILPMFHVFALNVVCLPNLHSGIKVVMLPGFEPGTFLKALEEHRVRRFFAPEYALMTVCKYKKTTYDKMFSSSLASPNSCLSLHP